MIMRIGSQMGTQARLWALGLMLATVAQAQRYKVLYSFQCGPNDGSAPEAGLTLDRGGSLYGTTYDGGNLSCPFGGCGTVFQIAPGGVEKVLYFFQGTYSGGSDGMHPQGRVVLDSAGNIYGTTIQGGDPNAGCSIEGCGTVFKISPQGTETVLHRFAGNADGGSLSGGLVWDHAGNLYGTSCSYGVLGGGTLFRISTDGSQYTILHNFSPGTDGTCPLGDLVRDAAGNLYGVANGGGAYSGGTVFKVDTSGNLTVLHAFSGIPDGEEPRLGLLRDRAGNLYGETRAGGGGTQSSCSGAGCGTVYKIDSAGEESVLYAFSGLSDGMDGANGLVMDTKGNLYGITYQGGDESVPCEFDGCGVLFGVSQTGKEEVLHEFGKVSGDGSFPFAANLVRVGSNLAGTTTLGGKFGCGTVFQATLP